MERKILIRFMINVIEIEQQKKRQGMKIDRIFSRIWNSS